MAVDSSAVRNRAYAGFGLPDMLGRESVSWGRRMRPKERQMQAARKWQGVATLGSACAVAAATAALASGASAAPTMHSCANKAETIQIEDGMGGTKPFKLTVKAISTHGVSCAAAYKFIGLALNNKTRTTPEKYKCTNGHFKAPLGYVAQVCTKAGARIQYAQQGG
jgi:hypothetical protein